MSCSSRSTCSRVSAPKCSYWARKSASAVRPATDRYNCAPHRSCAKQALSRSATKSASIPVPPSTVVDPASGTCRSGGTYIASPGWAVPPVSLVTTIVTFFSLQNWALEPSRHALRSPGREPGAARRLLGGAAAEQRGPLDGVDEVNGHRPALPPSSPLSDEFVRAAATHGVGTPSSRRVGPPPTGIAAPGP